MFRLNRCLSHHIRRSFVATPRPLSGPSPRHVFDLQNESRKEPDRDDILERLAIHGHVLIRNAPFENGADLHERYGYLMSGKGSLMPYALGAGKRVDKSGGKGVLNVGTEPYFLDVDLHNEMAYAYEWPSLFGLACIETPSGVGVADGLGGTMYADTRQVTRELMWNHPDLYDKYMRAGVHHWRVFTSADHRDLEKGEASRYTDWEATFGTSEKSEVERQCRELQWDFEWTGPDESTLKTNYRIPAFISLDESGQGEPILFNSAWSNRVLFDGWAPFNELPLSERPFSATWGDSLATPFTPLELTRIKGIYSKFASIEPWRKGDFMLVDNRLYSHGRHAYPSQMSRDIALMMGAPCVRTDTSQTNGVARWHYKDDDDRPMKNEKEKCDCC